MNGYITGPNCITIKLGTLQGTKVPASFGSRGLYLESAGVYNSVDHLRSGEEKKRGVVLLVGGYVITSRNASITRGYRCHLT